MIWSIAWAKIACQMNMAETMDRSTLINRRNLFYRVNSWSPEIENSDTKNDFSTFSLPIERKSYAVFLFIKIKQLVYYYVIFWAYFNFRVDILFVSSKCYNKLLILWLTFLNPVQMQIRNLYELCRATSVVNWQFNNCLRAEFRLKNVLV